MFYCRFFLLQKAEFRCTKSNHKQGIPEHEEKVYIIYESQRFSQTNNYEKINNIARIHVLDNCVC